MPFLVVPEAVVSDWPQPGGAAASNVVQARGLTNEAAAELDLLEAIDQLVHVEDDVGAVRDVYAAVGAQAVLLERGELGEEAGDVDDAAAADDVDAARVDEARGQDVEVVRDAVGDNRVAGVVAALGAAAELGLVGEDVGELALAFVAPLGAEHHGDGHDPASRARRGETETGNEAQPPGGGREVFQSQHPRRRCRETDGAGASN